LNSPSAPKPPDPRVVAEAQTKSNKETAVANAYLNRIDQTGPTGTSSYEVVGTNPDGTPKFAQTTAFSAPVQGLFDSSMAMNKGIADTGVQQIAGIQQQYAKPLDLNTEVENRIAQFQSARLDPSLQQQDEALRNRLTNQGFREGTEGWDRAMIRQGQIANDARNSMWLGARQQGVNEAMLQRQQPLAEFNAIRTGAMPQMPTFTGVPQTQQANTNIAGIYSDNYNQQMAAYNAQNSQNNAFMGGLFGLGGSLLAAPMTGGGSVAGSLFAMSDVRLKRDIQRIGSLASGLPVYSYRYLWSDAPQVGVMAHEARELFPDAVREFDGFLAVDYGKVG
jgi:hypothetical protein